jgi:hypothetical protein
MERASRVASDAMTWVFLAMVRGAVEDVLFFISLSTRFHSGAPQIF